MNAKWVSVDHEPEVNKYGSSEQLVLLTNTGNFNTGYFDSNKQRWEVEGLLSFQEYPVAWLQGVSKEL